MALEKKQSAREIINGLTDKKFTRRELVQHYIECADRDVQLNSFISRNNEQSLCEAEEWDRRGSSGSIPPMAGIPIGIKDNICIEGMKTTCASRMLENFIAPYDAHVQQRLKSAGLITMGKMNMDEFAMGSSNENSAFGAVCHPIDRDRIPGGSSGGSAAAVAAGLVPWALGSDTGGSIRQPAAFCGVVGMKPTYGRVSRYGLVAFASSFDQIGPITQSIYDNALLLELIAGHDERDSTSANLAVPVYSSQLELTSDITIGLPEEYFTDALDGEIRERCNDVRNLLEKSGIRFKSVRLPHTPYAVATYYILTTAEASSNLERYDGVKYGLRSHSSESLKDMYRATRTNGFGKEVKRRIMLGTYVLSSGYYDAYYLKASKVRTLIKEDFIRVFQECDLLLTPTTPTLPFLRGEKIEDPLTMYLSDIYTTSANLAGVPALAVPAGLAKNGLPMGIQLIGNYFDETRLYQIGARIEKIMKEYSS